MKGDFDYSRKLEHEIKPQEPSKEEEKAVDADEPDDGSAGFFDTITNSTVAPKEVQRGGYGRGGRGGRGRGAENFRKDTETFGEMGSQSFGGRRGGGRGGRGRGGSDNQTSNYRGDYRGGRGGDR